MKGIIFTEFTEMVEQQFGLETLDHIIESNPLPSKGAYTSVGTYEHQEMVMMLISLSKHTGIEINALLRHFGSYLLHRFAFHYPQFFETKQHPFELLDSVENHIHVEVLKLYPDAQLPRFVCEPKSDSLLHMHYYSDKHLTWLAVGLIEGVLAHYSMNGTVEIMEKAETDNKHETLVIQLRYA